MSGEVKDVGGRPPIYDLEKEAADLNAWAETDDATILYKFTKLKPYLASELSGFAHRNQSFAKALKKAKECIAVNRERLVSEGKLHNTAYSRNAGVYDHMLRAHEREIKDEDAARIQKQSIVISSDENIKEILAVHNNSSRDLVKKPKQKNGHTV